MVGIRVLIVRNHGNRQDIECIVCYNYNYNNYRPIVIFTDKQKENPSMQTRIHPLMG